MLTFPVLSERRFFIMEDKSGTTASPKTNEAVAADFRATLEKNGMGLAKLAEPLVKASCLTDEAGEAYFSEERFIDLLHVLANTVVSHPVEIHVGTFGFENLP